MIMIFGPAGSGKSTQGQMLAEAFGWKWLSVGQVLRNTGEFDEILKGGNLVNDDTVIELMRREMEKADADGMNMIVDGYPRNEYQAEWAAANIAADIEGILVLTVPEEELLKRLSERGRMDDGSEAVIRHRWEIYDREIGQILPLLEAQGIEKREVDGLGTVEEVFRRLSAAVMDLVPEAELQIDDVNGGEIEKSYGE